MRGLLFAFDELLRLLDNFFSTPAPTEFVLLILALISVLKGPLAIAGLALWKAKWMEQKHDWPMVGSFCAGAFTAFDWTQWELGFFRVLLAVAFGTAGIFLYLVLVEQLENHRTRART